MSLDVFVRPKTEQAERWLQERFEDIHALFVSIHSGTSDLRRFHPHEVYLEKQVLAKDASSVSRWQMRTGAHWDETHGERTVSDLKQVLSELGGGVDEFEFEVY